MGERQLGLFAGKNEPLVLVQGDITEQVVDAIVNAANTSLLGGGGVDGAIHRAGGPAILEACQAIRKTRGGCDTGDAVITTAGRLAARFVIHTVGPVYRGGDEGEAAQLASAYRRSLEAARTAGARTVAFPSISTGVYRYPIEEAAVIAVTTVRAVLSESPEAFDEVRFVLFSDADFAVYETALRR